MASEDRPGRAVTRRQVYGKTGVGSVSLAYFDQGRVRVMDYRLSFLMVDERLVKYANFVILILDWGAVNELARYKFL